MDKNLRIQVLLGAVDKLTRPLKVTAAEAKRTSVALVEARKRVKELNGEKARIDGFRRAKLEAGELRDKLDAARKRATALGKDFAAADKPTRKLAADFKAARKEVTDLETRQRAQQTTLNRLRDELNKAGHSTTDLARHEGDLKRQIHGATEEYERQKKALEDVTERSRRLKEADEKREKVRQVSDKLTSAGLKTEAAGAAVAAPLVFGVKKAIEFNEHLSNIRKQYSQDGGFSNADAFAMARRGVKLGIDPNGAGDIGGQLAMGGVKKKELGSYFETAAYMKEALRMNSAEDAGSMLSEWRHNLGLNASQARDQLDMITALSRKYGMKEGRGEELGKILAGSGNLGVNVGADKGTTTALGATMSTMGYDAGVASTAIRNLYIGMAKGDAATSKAKKAFKNLGLDAHEMAGQLAADPQKAVLSLFTAIHKLPIAARGGVLTQIFGSRSIGPIAALISNVPRVSEAFELLSKKSNYSGAALQEFNAKTDTTEFRLKQSKAKAELLATIIGERLRPTVDKVALAAGRWLDQMTSWTEAHPKLTKAITFAAVALSGFLLVAGGVALLAGALLGPLVALNLAFAAGSPAMLLFSRAGGFIASATGAIARAFVGAIPAVVEFGAALLMNPITWIVAGVVALAVAAFLVIRYWKPISAFFGRLWDGVKARFGDVMAWFGGLGATFAGFGRNLMQGLINGVVGMVGAVGKAISGVGGQVVDFFKAKLGIHSPSRVFAQLGRFTMAGLALGIDQGRQAPIRRAAAVAGGIAAAVIAGSGASAGAPIGAGASAAATHHHAGDQHFHIHAAPGMDERALAALVARKVAEAMAQQHRAAASTQRAAFADHDG